MEKRWEDELVHNNTANNKKLKLQQTSMEAMYWSKGMYVSLCVPGPATYWRPNSAFYEQSQDFVGSVWILGWILILSFGARIGFRVREWVIMLRQWRSAQKSLYNDGCARLCAHKVLLWGKKEFVLFSWSSTNLQNANEFPTRPGVHIRIGFIL